LLVTEAQDALTGQVMRLFNPRKDCWNAHFMWSADSLDLIGLTAIGRTTVAVLKINDAKRRYLRSLWKALTLHPPAGDNRVEGGSG